jgi:hypothetical protein
VILILKIFSAILVIFYVSKTPNAAADGIYIHAQANIKNRIHSIGISSNLGDTVEMTHIGATAFGNQWSQLPISDWRLNELVVQQAIKALEKNFIVRATPIDPELIAKDKKGFLKSDERTVSDVVRDLPPNDVDAYMIFLPYNEQTNSSYNMVSGFGVFWRWPGFGGYDPASHRGEAIIYLSYAIYIVDAKTHHVLDVILNRPLNEEKVSLADSLLTNARPLHLPHVHTGLTEWPATADTLTDDQKAELKADLSTLIFQSVGHTLATDGLADQTPQEQPSAKPAP